MRIRLFAILFLLGFSALATHNRSGYISYCWLYGNTYHFRIFTYTNLSSVPADRCEQTLHIDNTDSVVCPRTNGSGPCPNGGNGVDGVAIVPASGGYGGVKENIYEGSFVLNPGIHVLSMIDPNRDMGIINLGGSGSQNIAFALIDTIYILNIAGVGTNCTPTITNPPIQNACANQPWCYNPGCIDPENDSLSYSMVKSFEDDPNNPPGGVQPIFSETFPSNLSVDPLTGTLCWNNVSSQQGEYNIALLIKEYRKNPLDGKRYLVGETVFDIQILVVPCANPGIYVTQPPNVCLVAGQSYSVAITASVSPGGAAVTPLHLDATGLPLTTTNFTPTATFNSTPGSVATGIFSWSPSCLAVQSSPYYVTFQASDSNTPLANANFSTFNMLVISPPPTGVVATAQGSAVNLSWSPPASCGQTTGNNIIKYLIYRNDSCNFFVPGPCQTGVPASSGYGQIGSVAGNVTTFNDNNFGQGLTSGNSYSYLVVAQYADGSLSIASSSTANTCVTIKLDIPLMMKVSVDTTDVSVGRMLVWWKNPFVNSGSLDTNTNPGPYKYNLLRKSAHGAFSQVYTVTESTFHQLKQLADTTYMDGGLNTQDSIYFYKVEFYSNGNFLGNSNVAGSVFLKAVPHDKSVALSWTASVPWVNNKYYIFQQHYPSQTNPLNYDLIDSCTTTTYTVTGLSNGYSACFKVLTKGQYSNPTIARYIYNYSEKVCATPFDDAPPCQPTLSINGNCSTSVNTLIWNNPNHTCPKTDDVVKYYIYYTAFKDSALTKIDSLLNPNDTVYTTDFATSIAGCYVIVAVDSVGNQSALNNEVCTDNCPEYELPNIFTPNADNINDQYIPVKNRYIKDVEFTLYNRWGEIVFETTDPALKWDGRSKQMKQPVSDGTYYYICKVNELHYYGVKSRTLKGFVQILH